MKKGEEKEKRERKKKREGEGERKNTFFSEHVGRPQRKKEATKEKHRINAQNQKEDKGKCL